MSADARLKLGQEPPCVWGSELDTMASSRIHRCMVKILFHPTPLLSRRCLRLNASSQLLPFLVPPPPPAPSFSTLMLNTCSQLSKPDTRGEMKGIEETGGARESGMSFLSSHGPSPAVLYVTPCYKDHGKRRTSTGEKEDRRDKSLHTAVVLPVRVTTARPVPEITDAVAKAMHPASSTDVCSSAATSVTARLREPRGARKESSMQRPDDARTLQSAGTNPACRWTMSPGTRLELGTSTSFALRVVKTICWHAISLLLTTCSRRQRSVSWKRPRTHPTPSKAPATPSVRRATGSPRTLHNRAPAKRPTARAAGRIARTIAADTASPGDGVGSDAGSSFGSFCAHARACALVESPRASEVWKRSNTSPAHNVQ